MTDKDLLLSKLYDDNIIEYNIKHQRIQIRGQEKLHIANWNLKNKDFCLSYPRIWSYFETKTGGNYQEIEDLTSSILENHLKRKSLKTWIRNRWLYI